MPATARAAPIDLIGSYLTFREVFDIPGGHQVARSLLSDLDNEFVLAVCAELMARFEAIGADASAIERVVVEATFKEHARPKVEALLSARRRRFLAPQGLLSTAKLALDGPGAGGELETSKVIAAVLAVQDEENEAVSGDRAEHLFVELVRNGGFSISTEPATLIARLQVRWRELAGELTAHAEYVDLEAEFETVTGVSLADLTTVGFALYTRTMQLERGSVIPASYLSTLGWAEERMTAVLDLISAERASLAALTAELDKEFGFAWSFDGFRQFPVIRLSGGRSVVISPRLLLARIFGLPVIFDVVNRLEAAGKSSRASRVLGFFRHVCEVEAIETLRRITGGGSTDRVFTEKQLQEAFGRTTTADAAVEYPEAWLIVEVATGQLSRPAVVGGSLAKIDTDLKRTIVQKVRQIDSTIGKLRADESALTKRPAAKRRRFIPLLVSTEGLPINPMILARVQELIAAEGLLQGADVGALHILDQEELDLAEACSEAGLGGLRELLDEHEKSGLANMSFKDWLIVEKRARVQRAARLQGPFDRAWGPVMEAFEQAEGSEQKGS